MRNIGLIHGRGQTGLHPKELKDDWLSALNQGIFRLGLSEVSSDQVAMPFYAQLLAERVQVYIERHEITRRGEAESEIDDPDYNLFVERSVNKIESLIYSDDGSSSNRGGPIRSSQGLRAFARLADRGVPEATLLVMKNFLTDAYVYLTQQSTRKDVNELVLNGLDLKNETIVISHSLGSIIACDILSNLRGKTAGVKLITLGSPLGLPAVRANFSLPIDLSEVVSVWLNVRDAKDIVSLNKINPKDFIVRSGVEDVLIENQENDHHSAIGYLKSSVIAALIG